MPYVLAVDDEPPALRQIAHLLSQHPRVRGVVTASNAPHALHLLRRKAIDIVFMDAQMPGLSGKDLTRVLQGLRQPPAVVVTATDERTVDDFDLTPVDRVLKPYRPERLSAAVGRALAHLDAQPHPAQSSDRAPTPGAPGDEESIPVELGGVTRLLRRSDILYVSAQGDYARLHTRTGSHLLRAALSALEQEWASAGFVRIHRSHLIALPHVEEIRSEGGRYTVLIGGQELAVSRRHTRRLRDLLTSQLQQ